jgi:hypothetical protein
MWLNFQQFETSLLQKPVFTLFLGLFHLLPLNDFYHIYFVKFVFSFLGVQSLILFQRYCRNSFQTKSTLLFVFLFVILSPFFLNNFFRIRSDQFGLFLFILALYFQSEKKARAMLITLCVLPIVSVKSFIFFIPGLFLFKESLSAFTQQKSRRFKFYFLLTSLSLLVWVISSNVSSFYYYLETWKSRSDYSFFLLDYFKVEWPLLLLSLLANIYFLKIRKFRNQVTASFTSFLVLFLVPQSLPFFIASLTLLIYLPGFILLDSLAKNQKRLLLQNGVLIIFSIFQLVNLGYRLQNPEISIYSSNLDQLKYIQKVSPIVEKNNLTYLDGAGILPRANFNPCFISPDDLVANESCKTKLNNLEADAVIITQRLSFLGDFVYKTVAEGGYTQVKPNFWVKNKFLSAISPEEFDLQAGPIPVFIFGFD